MADKLRELNKRKLQALRMAGYNIKVDGSWGPWLEEQYKKTSTHKKHYQPDILGFFTSLYDKATGNDTYYEEPSIVTGLTGEIKADTRSNVRRKVDRMLLSSDNPVGYVVRNVLPAGAAAAGLVYGAPAALSVVKTVAPAALPSTYIDGFFAANGVTAPAWLTTGADMALSFKYANDARKELNLNGLNWKTGTNAVLASLPATKGGNSAYQTVEEIRNGIRNSLNSSKTYRSFRIARELNKGINNTKFTNVPVYHATDYLGNDLRPFSMTDWGLHMTPNYNTAQGIVRRRFGDGLHIKEGTFTYTNNTAPIRVTDQGNFQRGMGDFDYSGVEKYESLIPDNISKLIDVFGFSPTTNPTRFRRRFADYMLAKDKGPNYVYRNEFEGGGDSFAVLGNDATFSKNLVAKVNLNRPQMALPVTAGGRKIYTNGQLFNEAAMNPSNLAPYDMFDGTAYLITGRTLEEGIIPFREDLRRMYNSRWYRDRMLSLGKSDAEVDTAVKQINKNLDNTLFYVSENLLPPDYTAATGDDGTISAVMFNGSFASNPSGRTAIHELGHVSEVNNPIIKEHNQELARNLKAKIDRTGFTPRQNRNLDYFLDIYADGGTELSGQVRNALVTMQLKNITPKLYINSQYIDNDFDLSLYRDLLGDDVLEQVLKVALGVTPLIALNNGTLRTSKSDLQR